MVLDVSTRRSLLTAECNKYSVTVDNAVDKDFCGGNVLHHIELLPRTYVTLNDFAVHLEHSVSLYQILSGDLSWVCHHCHA